MTINKDMPIGFCDSGLGGLSVLKEARITLPFEDMIYIGDSKNAPYGTRTKEEIFTFTKESIKKLIDKGVKAVIVSCNTASVTAFSELKDEFKEIILIGTFPVILKESNEKVLVLATPVTIEKIKYDDSNHIFVGMDGLVELIENFDFDNLDSYFDSKIGKLLEKNIKYVSLSCTHYPFIKDYLEKYLNKKGVYPIFLDGSKNAVNELFTELKAHDLLNDKNVSGNLEIYNTKDGSDMIEKSFKLLDI